MKEEYSGYRKLEIRELQMLQLEAMKHIHQICVKNNIKYYIIAGSILGAVRHGGFIPWDDDIDLGMMRDEYERFKTIFPQQCNQDKYFLQHYDSDPELKPALMRVCIKNTILVIPDVMSHNFCHNTYLDIFPLDNAPDDEILQQKQAKRILKFKKRILNSYYYYNPQNRGLRVVREWVKKTMAICCCILFPKQKERKKLEYEMKRYDKEITRCVCSMASGYSYKKQTMPREYYGTPTLIDFEDTKFFGPQKRDDYLKHLYGNDYMTPRNKFKNGHGHDVYIKE